MAGYEPRAELAGAPNEAVATGYVETAVGYAEPAVMNIGLDAAADDTIAGDAVSTIVGVGTITS